MSESVLQLDPCDNVLVALNPLKAGTVVRYGEHSCTVVEDIPAKHKLAIVDLAPGDFVFLYGMVVGEAVVAIPAADLSPHAPFAIAPATTHRRACRSHFSCLTLRRGPRAPSWAITALTAR